MSGSDDGCLSAVAGMILLFLVLWALFEPSGYRTHCITYPRAWICLPIFGGDPPAPVQKGE